MAKITRIKAGNTPKKSTPAQQPKDKALDKKAQKVAKKTEKQAKKAEKMAKKAGKKPFILIRPLVYLGRYIRDSWREIRQVRWPSRKATWKLFFAILIYTVLFIALIMLLDALFAWIFKTVI